MRISTAVTSLAYSYLSFPNFNNTLLNFLLHRREKVNEAIEKLRKEKEDMQAELHKLQQEKETSNAVEATLQLKQADTSATGGMRYQVSLHCMHMKTCKC